MNSNVIIYTSVVVGSIGFGSFLLWFVLPGHRVRRTLTSARDKLAAIAVEDGTFTDLDYIANDVFPADPLKHAWSEFKDTLHPQEGGGEPDEFGGKPIERYRQTIPAEVYFDSDSLVLGPLRTEFFKHFPGVLTAMGIIGTFFGLIIGLAKFKTTGSIDAVNRHVDALVHSVQHAFFASFGFITLAVIITLWEKVTITRRLRLQGEVCVQVDRLFDAGAGEEYLARLVGASESSATRTAQLKDELVDKLEEMIDRQIKATVDAITTSADRQAKGFGEAVSEALSAPMEKIATAVSASTQDTGHQVQGLLADLLKDFSAQMNDMFGAQISELNQLMASTSGTLERTAARFDELVVDMQGAGREAADAMAERVEEAITTMAERQQLLDQSLRDLVSQLEEKAADRDTQASERMHSMLSDLGAAMSQTLKSIAADGEKIQSGAIERQEAMTEASKAALGDLREQVNALVKSNDEVGKSVRDSVETLASATTDSIRRIESGAKELLTAMDRLREASAGLSTAVEGVDQLGGQLRDASTRVASTLAEAGDIATRYQEAANAARDVVTGTRELVETVARDVRVTGDLVDGLERAAAAVNVSQTEVEQYLGRVNTVLSETHRSFASSIAETLSSSNVEFQRELAQATSHLSGAVKELGDVVEAAAELKD